MGSRPVYVISDLHIGGNEQLETVEFKRELLEFLTSLESADPDTELIINGDFLGLWEFTEAAGPEKLELLVKRYPDLFDQLRQTGEQIQITLLSGNHDHELVAYDAYETILAEYNITLETDPSVSRRVNGQTIHFEHGHQRDPNNRIPDWGNAFARPLGYHYNAQLVSRAGELSSRGEFEWLADIQAVTPTERIPSWFLSKYVYREMNPLLRYALIPFLLLFNISALIAIAAGLDIAGVVSLPTAQLTTLLDQFGTAGSVVLFLLYLNVAVAGLLLLIGIPVYLLRRDLTKTIDRMGLFETDLTVDPERPYLEAAEEIFAANPETTVFCYGHTHRPEIVDLDGGVLVNSGTWLKRLHRRGGPIGLLPPVYYPSYQLCAVRFEPTDKGVAIEYEPIDKPSPAPEELTLTERLVTLGRSPDPELPDPKVVTDD